MSSNLHQVYVINDIKSLNYRTKTFVLDRPLNCQPGQFVMVWLPDLTEKPFSIASADPLSLTIVAVGPFSKALHELKVGDRVWARGPFGHGFQFEGRHALLAGGGYGVAPLYFLACEALKKGISVDACIGARTTQDILLAADFINLNLCVYISTEDGSQGRKGLITEIIEETIQNNRPDCIYACGPTKMVEAIDALGAHHGIPRQLSWESHIRCGMGLCGRCELERASIGRGDTSGWLVCTDGPVSFEK
jgi:dihydroorotate dehydrogenase electron transfer subunit